ncbi:MAG: RnfABCDGE type electron transport complex subunit G [Prevotella sp.]|nr:RnfABCDGE type electron transport complex subunit G [Prevotella sp.]
MKKLESSITNMILALVGVAVIMGFILAYVNTVTAGPIAAQNEKTLSDGIKAVMGGVDLTVAEDVTVTQNIDGKDATFVVHKAVDKSNNPLGVAVESTTGGFGGDLKVLVGFDPEGNILGYTILQHSETPGLGAKAGNWFQEGKGSIIGKNPGKDNLTVSKDGGDIDAITASTITSRAFLKAVNQAYGAYSGTDVDTGATPQHAK